MRNGKNGSNSTLEVMSLNKANFRLEFSLGLEVR